MFELEGFREKLTEKGKKVLANAVEESKKRQHYYLGVEHIFLSFHQDRRDFFFRKLCLILILTLIRL